MKLGIRLTGIVTILALVVVPALSCFVPRQAMNMDDHACCKQMGDKCGGKNESSPKSCCATEDHGSQPYVASAAKSGVYVPLQLGLVLAIPAIAVQAVANEHETISSLGIHSPPRSAPEAIAILRI